MTQSTCVTELHRGQSTHCVSACVNLWHTLTNWTHIQGEVTTINNIHLLRTECPLIPANQTHGEVLLVCHSIMCASTCVCLRRIIACYYLCKPVPILLTLLLGVTSGTLHVYHAMHEEVLEIAAAIYSKCVYVCMRRQVWKLWAYPSLISFSVSPVGILIFYWAVAYNV